TGHVIIFNGEIYNYVTLRQQLTAAGEKFDSTGDTAVKLRLLSARGPDAVDQLRRMFALGLWDPASRTLSLARDALGLKPADLRAELLESVRLHLASDVPLGVFLSSGVDSGAVANLAQKAAGQPVNTFTLVFQEREMSEGERARAIAKAIGSNHREILLRESE